MTYTERRSFVLADSITESPDTPGVVISGSNGGLAAGIYALRKKVKGIVFNDAGVGKESAGIAALLLLQDYGIMAATVDAFSAQIGLADETRQGRISHINALAHQAGVRLGQTGAQAAERMSKSEWSIPESDLGRKFPEERRVLLYDSDAGQKIWAYDSNAQITEENCSDIIMSGSHCGLVGLNGDWKYPKVAALFCNDAGVGKDKAGVNLLPQLDRAGIIAAAVDANTARIGDGVDTYESGIVSYVNELAGNLKIHAGLKAADAARLIMQVRMETENQ